MTFILPAVRSSYRGCEKTFIVPKLRVKFIPCCALLQTVLLGQRSRESVEEKILYILHRWKHGHGAVIPISQDRFRMQVSR